MNKDEFAEGFKKFAPSRELFEQYGYQESLIEKKLKRCECVPAKKNVSSSGFSNEILNLLTSYDCSNVEIGILTFFNKINETENYFIIGEVEADSLVLNKITLEIQVLDHLDLNWVVWSCAANGDSFLDAVLLCAEYFWTLLRNPDLTKNNSFAYRYVEQCTKKAGGDKYIDFYKLLLGCFE